ncbi:MAG: ATP-binding protein [Planctomycetota bacterium]
MTQADPDNETTFDAMTIPTDLRAARTAVDVLVEKVEAAHYTVDAVFAIKLALEEAVANAIKHGNACDPSKQVLMRYAVSPQKCVIIIRDQGRGFSPEDVPDCTCAERLPLPNGRGIMLMRAYMDEVTYRKGGTEIYLMKRNE